MTSSEEIRRLEICCRINRVSAYSRRESFLRLPAKRSSKCSNLVWITTLRRVNWRAKYWRWTAHIFRRWGRMGHLATPGHSKPFTAVMELRLDRFLRGGDHSSFSAEDFPAIRFTEWRENYNHQHQHVRMEKGIEYGDLLKFDDFSYIAQVARLNIATLATLAFSPGMPGKCAW